MQIPSQYQFLSRLFDLLWSLPLVTRTKNEGTPISQSELVTAPLDFSDPEGFSHVELIGYARTLRVSHEGSKEELRLRLKDYVSN